MATSKLFLGQIPAAAGGITGTLAAVESGFDAAALSGAVAVAGTLAATEAGADAAALSGAIAIAGSLSAIETGADAAAISGGILVSGTLASVETGTDTAHFVGGGAEITGSLAAVESGSDAAALTGQVHLYGSYAILESGIDAFALSGQILVSGTLAAVETGLDIASFVSGGSSGITGVLSANESPYPTASEIAAAVLAAAQITPIEATSQARVLEGGKTEAEVLRLLAAVLAGKVSGAGTGTETFKGLDGTTDRVVSTVDSSGNRTAVVYDGA